MKIILNAILKFLAFLLAGVLIIALPVSLIAYNAGEVLFDQEQITNITTEVIVDSELIPAALEIMSNTQAEKISEKIETTDRPEGRELNLFNLIYYMEEDNWMSFQEALLEEGVVRGWIENTVNGFFNWINSEEPVPYISWDLNPVVDRMRGPQGRDAVVAFYDSLPDCTDLQMEEMQTNPGDPLPRGLMVMELCKLSTFPHGDQIQVYEDVLGMVIDATPPEFNVTQSLLRQRGQINGVYTLKWRLRDFRYNLDTAMLVPLGLLFLILITGVRSMEGLGQWFGIPMIGGGLIALISSLLFRPLWRGWLAERIPEVIPQTSLLYHEMIDGSTRVLSPVFSPLAWQAFILLLIGAGLTAMGFILRMRRVGD